MAKDYLLLISDREPLAWLLTKQRMAFPAGRRGLVSQLAEGDRLFLYTTRSCFRNPRRDTGRVFGEAQISTAVRELDEPVIFGDRSYPLGCGIHISGLAPRDTGPELRTLVNAMHLFPNSENWSVYIRRVLVPLDKHDAALVTAQLAPLLGPSETHIAGYMSALSRRQGARQLPPPSHPKPACDAQAP
jgi:hypothetical protein